ncbi:MAG TPA: hypothetical protein VE226_00915, partial [Nitrososphaeraceae archaeon]|nr:hypothetical protein [Nitrososphaeraceae archaeon]
LSVFAPVFLLIEVVYGKFISQYTENDIENHSVCTSSSTATLSDFAGKIFAISFYLSLSLSLSL